MVEASLEEPLPDGSRLVVAPLPSADLIQQTAAIPEVAFILLGAGPQEPAENVVVLAPSGLRPDLPAFAAGVVAATVTEDWRAGVAGLGSGPEARARRLAFLNGVEYVCGLCRPAYPPFLPYPVDASPPEPDAAAAINALLEANVTTAYLFADSDSDGLFEAAAQAGLRLIGEVAPKATWQDAWVATVGYDLEGAVLEAWRALSEGQGGYAAQVPVALKNVNSAVLTEGRQRAVEMILNDLNSGFIGTGVGPEGSDAEP